MQRQWCSASWVFTVLLKAVAPKQPQEESPSAVAHHECELSLESQPGFFPLKCMQILHSTLQKIAFDFWPLLGGGQVI